MKVLLENGAIIHAFDDLSLRWSAGSGHIEVVKVLLKHCTNVHTWCDHALRVSAEHGNVDDNCALVLSVENGHV